MSEGKWPASLWSMVCETDPRHTKTFTRGGGFSGTAINATYLSRRATEVFGPCGIGWGVDVVDEKYVPGAPFDGGHEVVHVLRIKLWYHMDGQRGEVTHFGQTVFVGRNKHGVYTDEEAPKKSMTDAISKALSMLGFSADVHLGLYDDNKYVAELRRRAVDAEKKPDPADDAKREALLADLQAVAEEGTDAYKAAWQALSKEARDMVGAEAHTKLKERAVKADLDDQARHA